MYLNGPVDLGYHITVTHADLRDNVVTCCDKLCDNVTRVHLVEVAVFALLPLLLGLRLLRVLGVLNLEQIRLDDIRSDITCQWT